MKQFEIITESDARVLGQGETVLLVRGGHVTPLAQDTLNARRIKVVREGQISPEDERLVPRADVRSVAVSSDHTGVVLRRALVGFLRGRGLAVDDLGTDGTEPVDYPDMAALVAERVARGDADAGIVIDGAGIGSAIAANKIHGVRAVMASSETIARYSREHNGANVLTLGSTLLSLEEARAIVLVWLATPMREPRYIRRLTKIRDLERRQAAGSGGRAGKDPLR
jgi:ribose 5-phosphate isomerase B